jgi:hypothetical protein
MRHTRLSLGLLLLGALAFLPPAFAGQPQSDQAAKPAHSQKPGARPAQKDPDPHAYKNWNADDHNAYKHYYNDQHRGYKAYNKLTPDEQTKYWNWRQNHPEYLGHPNSLVGHENPNKRPPQPDPPVPPPPPPPQHN